MIKLKAWSRTKRGKWTAGAACMALVAALISLLGASSTSSLFSDTHGGTIAGGVGNVHITVNGSTATTGNDLSFGNNMLPGIPNTVNVTYQNTGSGPEDVYLTLPNETALSALNSLGTYGEVHVVGNNGSVFDSANLKDTAASCGTFAPNGCWPLLKQYKIAMTLNPGDTGTFTFTFMYAAKLSTEANAGTSVPWNSYPIAQGLWTPSNTGGQTYIKASDGTGSGLPYALVATAAGQSPA